MDIYLGILKISSTRNMSVIFIMNMNFKILYYVLRQKVEDQGLTSM